MEFWHCRQECPDRTTDWWSRGLGLWRIGWEDWRDRQWGVWLWWRIGVLVLYCSMLNTYLLCLWYHPWSYKIYWTYIELSSTGRVCRPEDMCHPIVWCIHVWVLWRPTNHVQGAMESTTPGTCLPGYSSYGDYLSQYRKVDYSWCSDAILILWIWPVFSMQFNFGLLGNHTAGETELISSYIYQFLPILGVIGLFWKL